MIKSTNLYHTGTADDFATYLELHTQLIVESNSILIKGPKFNFNMGGDDIKTMWPALIHPFASLFCTRVSTETRITESNSAPSFAALTDTPSNPIHLLYQNDELEDTISNHFQKAFGEELIVFRLGGNVIPLLVGQKPTLNHGEDRLSKTYNERLIASSTPLDEQGDGMRSFASVILCLLAPTTPSILLLDEPEAFLHPPQARLLGEIIAQNKPNESQLFIATHSPDVLQGLITTASKNLHVLRLQRDGNINRTLELDKELVKEVSRDPLMMQSSIMSGVFHERVIICDSDTDCMFYRSILNLPAVHGDQYPDVLFVHANGKHRIATLANVLIQLGVPVDIIVDMDVLNDIDIFKKIIETLGGNWNNIESLARSVKSSIEQHKPWLTGVEIKREIEKILTEVPKSEPFPRNLRLRIQAQFRKASPWDAVKQAGVHAIPAGQAASQYKQLESLCSASKLWIVPVGQVEGFCKTVGNHGPRWVQEVLEQRNVEDDSELQEAREFLARIWAAK